MKKKSLLLMSLLALVCACFVSCSKDDDDKKDGSGGNIVGYWSNTENPKDIGGMLKVKSVKSKLVEIKILADAEYLEDYLVFEESGVAKSVVVQMDKDKSILAVNVVEGSYVVKDNMVTMTSKNKEVVKATFSVKKDKLTLTTKEGAEDVSITYKSVKESVVKKYLEWTPPTLVGAWEKAKTESMGDFTLRYYDIYNEDGTMREYLTWFDDKGKFTSSEYKDYDWKVENGQYYQKEKGEPKYTSALDCKITDKYLYFFNAVTGLPVIIATRIDINSIKQYIDGATPAL